jgi:hypothetical protein
MDKLQNTFDICHKCGGDGVYQCEEIDEEFNRLHNYNCEDCDASWLVYLKLTPYDRHNG